MEKNIKKSFLSVFIFLFLNILGISSAQAQSASPKTITVYTQDFGSGTAHSTCATPAATLLPGTTSYTAVIHYGTGTAGTKGYDLVQDGYYAISNNSRNGTDGFSGKWINAGDRTSSDGTGNMMIVNANVAKEGATNGTIIDLPVSVKAVPGATFQINVYAANLTAYGITGQKPGYLGLEIYTGSAGSGTLSTNTYTLNQTTVNDGTLPWQLCNPTFTLPTNTSVSTVHFDFYNSDPTTSGNNGNDFVIDDISIEQEIINLSGTVYNDANWDGTGTYTSGNGVLYVVLVDNNNTVVSVAPVQADGTYSFTDVPYASSDIGLKLILTSDNPGLGTTNYTPSSANFPKYLFPTGVNKSNLSTASQYSTLLNVMSLSNTSADITKADFGITQASFGDAPDSYGTTISNTGAESAIKKSIYIGSTVNSETDGNPTTGADAHSSDDGVSGIPSLMENATGYSLPVFVYNNTGSTQTLQGWIDFNRNGTFDAGEYATVSVPSSTSQQNVTLDWNELTGGVAGTSYIRLRLNDDATKSASDATGVKGAGEVEDYTLCILPAPPTSGGDITQCAETPLQTLTASASVSSAETLVWYDAATGGNIVTSPTLNTGTVTYYAQANANTGGCSSTLRTPVTLTINPIPTITASVTPNPACAGENVNLAGTFTSNGTSTSISSWSWSGPNGFTSTKQNPPVSSSITSSEAGVYTVQATDNNGCKNSASTSSLTVNPLPTLSGVSQASAVCSGSNATIELSGLLAGTTQTISYKIGGGGTTQTDITSDASGTGSFTVGVTSADNGQVLTITGIKATGCNLNFSSSNTVTLTVNAVPIMSSATSKTICSGSNVSLDLTSDIASGYNWVATNNANVTGESTTAQTGSTINDVLTNTGTTAQTVTYTVIPTSTTGSCPGTAQTVTVTVNPTAEVDDPGSESQTVCNGSSTTAINFSTNNTGGTTTYSWANNNTSVGLAASGTDNIASFTAVNSGTSPVTATITVTPHYTNSGTTCDGTGKTVTVTVNPTPTLSSTTTPPAICSGSTFSYNSGKCNKRSNICLEQSNSNRHQ